MIIKMDLCACCLKPEGFYIYANNNGLSDEEYKKGFPCSDCKEIK
jgi:hypothetical protein